MSILIFIVILSTLVIVHELGHFSVAKLFGIRVDEFGLGYPPRLAKLFSWKGTPFTLNWLPFGGFVKIFGENPSETSEELSLSAYGQEENSQPISMPGSSFQDKNRGIQAAVLVAGVLGNFIFAWFLISLGFMTGIPAPAGLDLPIENPHTVITTVIPGSPAELAGLKSGDVILSISRGAKFAPSLTPEVLAEFISESFDELTLKIDRGGEVVSKKVTPRSGIVAERPAVGMAMDTIGTVTLPPHKAVWYGLKSTSELTWVTGQAIINFIYKAVRGSADLASVTGPVGIVGMVGDVTQLGFGYLLTFAALISINLAIINLLPFPALDGGRLLFVIIEALTRRPIPARVFNALNTAGFALLILLMILITIKDVRNIL